MVRISSNAQARRFTGVTMIGVALALSLSACSSDDIHSSLGYSDQVVTDTGDANAANSVAQTIDPWSPASQNNKIDQDGQRARIAAQRYATDSVKDPGGLNESSQLKSTSTGGVTK
ncbi:MAG: hypothetical protein ACR2PA_09210 [Hyphomicrobiaceae bacterium]